MNIPAPSFKKLYEDFKNQSQSKLNEEQFLSLLIFFPAILVIAADGTIDHEEWFYLNQLVKAMANGFDDDKSVDIEELIENYQTDIRFLIRELHTWEVDFLPFLKSYLQKNPTAKEDVEDVIYMVADASEGISKKEKKRITELNEVLDLQIYIED